MTVMPNNLHPDKRSLTLSVVITAHHEGRLLRPTIEGVLSEIDRAGVRRDSEILLVCDNADELTLAVSEGISAEHSDIGVRVLQTSFGEPGGARNAGIAVARGTFVAVVDGDDVVGGGFFDTGLRLLQEADSPVVVHPHLVLSFGARRVRWILDSTADRHTSFLDLIRYNQWPSTAIAERALFERLPHISLPSANGYGPEDWMWNIEAVLHGAAHVVAENSVLCYRVRASGGINNGHRSSMLPHIDMEALEAALPLARHAPPSANPIARTAKWVGRGVYRVARPIARFATHRLTYERRRRLYLRGQGLLRRLFRLSPPPEPVVHRPAIEAALTEVSMLDPAISWAADQVAWVPEWISKDDGYGRILADAYAALNGVEAIVAVPWVGVGGADIVSINYARALQQTDRYRGKVAILGTYLEERTHPELLPEGVRYVHLPKEWLDLGGDERRRLIAQLMVQVRPKLVVSVNCFHFTEALEDFSRPMTDGTDIFLTLFAFDRVGRLRVPVSPITDDSQRQYLDRVRGVITDNLRMAGVISKVLGLPDAAIVVHRQPALNELPELRRDTVAYTEADPATIRLLWPHRLDPEKRPDTLIAIAERLRAEGVAAEIDVYGQRVLSGSARQLESQLRGAGIRYRGPYRGGLSSLPTETYHAMLLTSEYEGLPLVIVQALLLGLPTIASAVGGVPEIIEDGRTGLLTEGPDDVEGFVTGIRRIAGDIDLRRTVIETGYDLAAEQHSWNAFRTSVETNIVRPDGG